MLTKTKYKMPQKLPKVNQANEFKEIANDFTNPLELIREAISNSFDAKANNIHLIFEVVNLDGEDTFKITIKDDGEGMDEERLENFFDLGNSSRKEDEETIGEKGHGTKVYFNSKKLEVKSKRIDSPGLIASMDNIFQSLNRGDIPAYNYEFIEPDFEKGTEIIIYGYNQSKLNLFQHDQIRDYIIWKTKFGSVENEFDIIENKDRRLHFKGLDKKVNEPPEIIKFGHIFPDESENIDKLFEKNPSDAPDYFCKRWIRSGTLPNHPHIEYKAVFYVEGKNIKYSYNKMLRRQGYVAPEGSYTIQDRYGLWLCKDYIPIQKKNEWIITKGSEFTKFHAFFNCQKLKLTANRGSIDNTNHEIMKDIESVARRIYESITVDDDYSILEWLEEQVKGYTTKEKEKKEYTKRLKTAYRQNICFYKNHKLVEPELESGVYALIIQLNVIEPDLFPFEIIDYNTNTGVDILVKEANELTLEKSRVMYVELKKNLDKQFNHSFEYIHTIICWDTKIKDNDEIMDLGRNKRIMKIVNPDKEIKFTRYYLTDNKGGNNIKVFVLKDFLKQKLGIDFRPASNK